MELHTVPCGPISVNTYVVAGQGKSCVVIDPGDPREVSDFLKSIGRECGAVLLTHGHFDHILGVAGLVREFPGCRVLIHPLDAFMLRNGRSCLAYQFGCGFEPVESFEQLQGDSVEVCGIRFGVLHTPGHTQGSVSYLLPEENCVFCGDTLFRLSAGRTDLPGGSDRDLLRSIKTLLESVPDETVLYPGHEEATDCAFEKAHNPYYRF